MGFHFKQCGERPGQLNIRVDKTKAAVTTETTVTTVTTVTMVTTATCSRDLASSCELLNYIIKAKS